MNHETEKQELQKQKTDLCLSRREHESKLTAVKSLVRSGGRLPNEKYKQCCDSQRAHTRAILNIETQLAPIKTRLREIADIEFKERNGGGNGATKEEKPITEYVPTAIVAELVALRQEYQNFSADGTRVASMRRMAAEFVLKLNPIIKQAIHSD